MSAKTVIAENLNQSGQNIVRILIASYFIAVSLGMIPGTDGSVLAQQVFPDPAAKYIGNTVVFTLAYLVMMGIWLRPAALLLALTMFWSSYIANFGTDNTLDIGDFWRDLALIGALILTYAQSGPRATSRRAMLRWTPKARQIKPDKTVMPRRIASAKSIRAKITPLAPHIAARNLPPVVENIFVEEADTETDTAVAS